MHRVLAGLLGGGLVVNGIFMLAAPGDWFHLVPGAAESGPFNGHFARDVGVIYLLGGLAFLGRCLAAGDRRAHGAAALASGFLTLHALIHLGESLAGHHALHLLRDLPGVYGPAGLALWLVLPSPFRSRKVTYETVADRPLHRGL